jgi:transcriptional regulator with XRE-family HTH domain
MIGNAFVNKETKMILAVACSFLNCGDEMETIGDRIRKARMRRNLTQPQLAELIGVSKGTISMWETGVTTPKGANLLNVAACLKLRPGYVMSGDMPVESNSPRLLAETDKGAAILDEVSRIMMGLTPEEQKVAIEILRAWSNHKLP